MRRAPARRRPPQPRGVRAARSAREARRARARHGARLWPRRPASSIRDRSATTPTTFCATRPPYRSRRARLGVRRAGTCRLSLAWATGGFPTRALATCSSTLRAIRMWGLRAASSTCGAGVPRAATSASGRTTTPRRRRHSRRFVDRVCALRAQHPEMHVFHYAPHEASKLRSLSVEYATREEEVDDLLRHDVLVDLYAVVRQGLQVGEESYSLKKLERHHGFRALGEAGPRGRRFDRRLRDLARDRRRGAPRVDPRLQRGGLPIDALPARLAARRDAARGRTRVRRRLRRLATRAEEDVLPAAGLDAGRHRAHRRLERWPAGGSRRQDNADEAERRLLAHLLLYHRREGKPEWWRLFRVCADMPLVELDRRARRAQRTRSAIARRRAGPVQAVPGLRLHVSRRRSSSSTLGKVRRPARPARPTRSSRSRTTASSCAAASDAPPPAPAALIAGRADRRAVLREALMELAESVLAARSRRRGQVDPAAPRATALTLRPLGEASTPTR